MSFEVKCQSARTLLETFINLGDESKIDQVLSAFKGEKERMTIKRGSYGSDRVYYQAVKEGAALPPELTQRAEKYGHVPGKTQEDKERWIVQQLRKSRNVYREYPDGSWSLRKNGNP